MVTHPQVVAALGAGDCEVWRPGPLHQPVNALSSLAFAVAGVWVAIRPGAARADRADRVGGAVYAGALIGNGVGSFLYHGPAWPGSAFVHDAAIPAALLFIVAEDVALLRGWTSRRRLGAYALGLGAACLTVAAEPGSSVAVTAAAGALVAAAEGALAVRRGRGDPTGRGGPCGGRRPARAAGAAPVAVILGVAGLAALAGRTGSPLCHPDGLLQGHALWHVLAAAALVRWDRTRLVRRAGAGGPAAERARARLRTPVPWGGRGSR
jgi:hypothetical protein